MAISTAMFHYDKQDRCFSQEISILQGGPKNRPVFEQIFPDACDEGIRLISEQTGRECAFYVHKTHQRDTEITHWELHVTPDSLRKMPYMKGITIIIWND